MPPENPVTPERVALGRKLYFDKRLSADGTVSCATCHDRAQGFADGKPVSEGIGGKRGARNAPTVLNAMFNEIQFWDGRAPTLEEQAKLPIDEPDRDGHGAATTTWCKAVADPGVPGRLPEGLRRAPSTTTTWRRAIAAFERTVVLGDCAVRPLHGRRQGARCRESAQRGWALFNGKARCNTCHPFSDATPLFSDNRFHNIGVAAKPRLRAAIAREARDQRERPRRARARTRTSPSSAASWSPSQPKDIGAFKTPGTPQHRAHRALHARRQRSDAVGRDGPLQQGRRGEPVPRRRHRAARR